MEVAGIKISSCCAPFLSSHDSELEKDAPTKKFDDNETAFDDKYTPINKFDEVAFSNKNNTKQEL
jgi:queuine tRNA-ribosyltransferase